MKRNRFDSTEHKSMGDQIDLRAASEKDLLVGEDQVDSPSFDSGEHKRIGDRIKLRPASESDLLVGEDQVDQRLLDSIKPNAIGDRIDSRPASVSDPLTGEDQVDSRPFDSGEHSGIGDRIKLRPASESDLLVGEDQVDQRLLDSIKPNAIGDRLDLRPASVSDPLTGEDQVDRRPFTTREHKRIADNIRAINARQMKPKEVLTLPNGVQLTFGDIIALAGDYYGIPEEPIINLKGHHQVDGARKRFMAAYYTLAIAPYSEVKEQLDKLLPMLKSGKCHHSDQEWDEATGGRWLAGLPLAFGQMMKLAESNYDHFQPQAKKAYLIGHQLAMEKAREAGKSSAQDKEKKLDEAYSLDAFACHFLTDIFSSGHIRTPRVELAKSTKPARVGHLLSKYMHDEDNKFGLRVTNMRGDKWISYGDGMLMEECSKKNFELVAEAVQKSVDQVRQVFLNPKATLPPSSVVTELIPFVDMREKNNSPLFQVKDGKLHRRSDINNLQDTKTVSNWSGSTTAVKLQFHKPANSAI